jgi:hypothetical protein
MRVPWPAAKITAKRVDIYRPPILPFYPLKIYLKKPFISRNVAKVHIFVIRKIFWEGNYLAEMVYTGDLPGKGNNMEQAEKMAIKKSLTNEVGPRCNYT